MLTLLYRKMINTKWLVLCLLLGFAMAAGMLSTMPIYIDASLQRLLIKDMQSYQLDTGLYPGTYTIEEMYNVGLSEEQRLKILRNIEKKSADRVDKIKLPLSNSKTIASEEFLFLASSDVTGLRAKVINMSDFEEHIEIVDGRMYNSGWQDGFLEVVVNEKVLKTMRIVLDGEYYLENATGLSTEPVPVKIVGTYKQKTDNDVYWSEGMDSYLNALFMDEDTFFNLFLPLETPSLSNFKIIYNFDYQKLDVSALTSVSERINKDAEYYESQGFTFNMGVNDIFAKYGERAESLSRILWVLQIPAMVMLAFYLFMVSKLNIEQEKNEIAVFKSRGASSKQIFTIYAMQAGILGIITLIVAPFIGLALCDFIGVSNGFLEFVNRPALDTSITLNAVLYALLAVIVFFVATILPIIPASRVSIVEHKQKKTKRFSISLWELFLVDIILIYLSLKMYFDFNKDLELSIKNKTFVGTGEVNGEVFVMAVMLIMGLGLLFIRIYPLIIRLFYFIGKKVWTPSQYIALTSVSRAGGGRERFLMLFLVITFAFGIFAANTARAINNHIEDMIRYSAGADISLQQYWTSSSMSDDEVEQRYVEPDIDKIADLEGVKDYTKVLRNQEVSFKGAANVNDAVLMAIEPDKFANIAWFRNDLTPVHWWNYINALIDYPTGVIASTSLQEKGYNLGDEITVSWARNEITLTIMSFVDYWSGINPYQVNDKGEYIDFVIGNFSHITDVSALQPYEVWLELEDNVSRQELYQAFEDNKIKLQLIRDADQLITAEKTDPSLQGMNGALTLSFIIIMIMALIGFLIYWILAIKSRTLQFGVLRAMGMSFREVIITLFHEQILVSGVSIAMAFIFGGIASDLYVPLFQTMYDLEEQIPPFVVKAEGADYIKIYVLIAVMLIGGFITLGRIIGKININKALKLGED